MAELKNFMDLLFEEQPFDDRKLQQRSAGLKHRVAAASHISTPAYGLLLRGASAQLPGGAACESAAASFSPGT